MTMRVRRDVSSMPGISVALTKARSTVLANTMVTSASSTRLSSASTALSSRASQRGTTAAAGPPAVAPKPGAAAAYGVASGKLADLRLEQGPGLIADLLAPFLVEASRAQPVPEARRVHLIEGQALPLELALQGGVHLDEVLA